MKNVVTKDNCEELTGYPPDYLASLTGIGAYTTNYTYNISGTDIAPIIVVDSNDGNIHLRRTFHIKRQEIDNDRIEIKNQSKGTGLNVFYEQVRLCEKAGFKRIYCVAAKDEKMNGHYTWARFGYIIDEDNKEDIEEYLQNSGYAGLEKEPHCIVLNTQHRDWWRQYGTSWTGYFDLNSNSESMKILMNYREEKKK